MLKLNTQRADCMRKNNDDNSNYQKWIQSDLWVDSVERGQAVVGRRVTLYTLFQVSALDSFFTAITLNLKIITKKITERERERVERGEGYYLVCELTEDEYVI